MDTNKGLEKILKFRNERDWEQFHSPKNLAISLLLEASEVLELFQWTQDNNLPENKREALRDELADVYAHLLLLAHIFSIDLENSLDTKIQKSAEKYPVEKSKGNALKYTEL
jgi:NTP pyrophosphatase (non-canonical NTP hydrolase)